MVLRMADAVVRAARQRIAILVALAVLGLAVVTAMALTSNAMSDIRGAFPPLSRAMNWLEGLDTPFDMDHVAFFALVTCAIRLLLPRLRWWWIALAVVAMAAGTELMQFAVPGRTPKLQDARDDLLGGGIGLLLGGFPLWLARFTPHQLGVSRALLLAGVVMLPLQQWSPLQAFGFPGLVSDGLFAAAVGVRALAWLGGQAPLRINKFHGWLLAYLIAMGLACMTAWPGPDNGGWIGMACPLPSPYLWTSVGKWIGIAYLAGVAVVVADFARDAWFMKELALAWIVAAAVTSVISMLAIIAFYAAPDATWLQPLLSHYGSLPPGNYPRVQSLFADANMLCNYLVVAVCLLLLAHRFNWISHGIFKTPFALMLVAGLATISPGLGGLVLVLATWVWLLTRDRSPKTALAILLAGCGLALLIYAGMWLNLADPFATESVRARIWQQAVQTFLAHPLRGAGLTVPVVGVAFTDPSGGQQWLTDAYNTWLNVGGQAGLLGIAALAGLCVWLLRNAWRAAGRTDVSAATALALLLSFVGAFGYGGLTGSFEDARHLWVLIGMLGGLPRQYDRRADARPVASGA